MSTKKEWKARKISLGTSIVAASAAAAICLIVGVVVGVNWDSISGALGSHFSRSSSVSIDWTPLNEVYSKLVNYYNGDISQEEIIEGAKKGLTEALGDPYTVYMDVAEAEEFNNSLSGDVGAGIGVEMGLRDGYVRVLRTLPDNPAKKAGILAGDIIYKVDGEDVYTLTTDEIATKVRGAVGTEVTITVVRDGVEKSFTLVREKINNVSAYVTYSGNIAIITVTRFDKDTGTLVQNMANQFGSNINKVILDLRNNGGGYVDSAKTMLSLWIDGQVVMKQKSKHLNDTDTVSDSGKAKLANMKTVVLVNENTASASEIVAGALQDYGKATIVGKKTYGKGVMQNLYTFSNGSEIKITTASWFTPNGRSINGEGITPDVEVDRSYDDINANRDPQMDKAKAL